MASVYKNEKRYALTWVAFFRSAEGKFCNKTTKETDRKKAKAKAVLWERPWKIAKARQRIAERMARKKRATLDVQIWDLAEISARLSSADQEWQSAIIVAYYTGIRLSDAIGLRWGNVDLKTGFLRLLTIMQARGVKTRQLEIPLHPELARYWSTLSSGPANSFLCPFLSAASNEVIQDSFAKLRKNPEIDEVMRYLNNGRFSAIRTRTS